MITKVAYSGESHAASWVKKIESSSRWFAYYYYSFSSGLFFFVSSLKFYGDFYAMRCTLAVFNLSSFLWSHLVSLNSLVHFYAVIARLRRLWGLFVLGSMTLVLNCCDFSLPGNYFSTFWLVAEQKGLLGEIRLLTSKFWTQVRAQAWYYSC